MQLKLYPATLTKAQFEAGAAALCALPYALQPRCGQTVNGDWSLSFQYPLTGSTGADLLALDMLVLADGQLYRVEDRERGSGRDSERCTIRAVHMMYDMRNHSIENIETAEITPGGVNQQTALEQVLNGSAFSVGTVDTDIVLDYLDILQKDVMWAIKEQILPQWGGELLPDNWTINIRKQMGADRGVHLRHGKNIKGVRYSESLDGVVTRLHILGYQNANIESINDGKDYIDSANIGLWSNPREDYVTFPDDDLPEDLLSKGTAYLATVDTPRIKLSVDLAQVRTSAQYAHYKDLEAVSLGDTVTVYHSRLGINITARVQSREFDPVTGENYRVELGNDNRNLYSSIASLQQAADITRMIADRNGHVRGERLRGVIDLLTSRLFASGSYVNAVVNDETGALFENTNIESVDYGAMFIGPGIFAIANEKDVTGQWSWRTFGTAGGFYGNELVAGSVTANKLASDVGQSLDLSSNTAITQIVETIEDPQAGLGALMEVLSEVETQLDGKIETFNQTTDPATAWNTPELKALHSGDLWYHTTAKETKRWSGTAWVKLLNDEAQAAAVLAGAKRRVFVATPAPPYDVGDLWTQGISGDIMRCQTAKATGGSYAAGDWVKASKYTDDAYATTKYEQTNNAFRWLMGYGDANSLDINNATTFLGLGLDGLEFLGKNVKISATEGIGLYVKGKIDDIKVGGTNLYRDSAGPFSTNRHIMFDTWDIFAGLPDDTPVTISFDIQAQYARSILIYPYQNHGLSIKDSKEIIPSTSGFTRKTFTTSVKNWGDTNPSYTDGAIALYDYVGANNYVIKNFKIEKGTMATDWSPSPEDTVAALSDLQTQVDGKTQIFYTSSAPTPTAVGDIWYDTGINPVVIKRWSGSSWVDITTNALSKALEAAGTAKAIADGKIRTFAQDDAPTAMTATDVGDLWFDTNDNNKPWRWSGSAWVPYQDTHLDSRMQSAEQKITPDAITSTVRNHANYKADLAGKNRTYVLDSPPSGAITGDLWIDTANNNMLKRWNGSSWVAVQDGAISIAQQQADKIQWLVASGTSGSNMVLTEYLYSLIANNINLSANSSIKLAVSGGTNLRPESTPMSSWNLTVTQRLDNLGLYKGTKSWTVSNRAGTPAYVRLSYGMAFRAGVTYTASFYGYLSAIDNVSNIIYYDGSHPPTNQTAWTMKNLGLGYYHFSFSFTPSWTGDGGEGVLVYANNLSAGQAFWISGIKIEEGTMATDWSPSPSDPASGVKAAGIEIGPGIMRQYADLDWSMTAGSGASEIGMANKRADGLFVWGGGSPTSAKTRMWMDGSARFDQIMIGNSGVNQFTQMYPYTDADNADDLNSMFLKVFVPADCSGVQSLKLSFALEAFRAYSKGAASGGSGTSGVNTAGEAGFNNYTGYAGSGVAHSASSSAQGISVSETGDHRHSYSYTITVLSHTHGTLSHTHPITYGIYAGPVATSCQVIVDGVNIGSFASLTARDITAQLTKSSGKVTRDTWHTIELKPNGLTRIVAQAFLVAVVATANNAIY